MVKVRNAVETDRWCAKQQASAEITPHTHPQAMKKK